MLLILLPVSFASKDTPVMAPSVVMSQSEVLIEPVSPLSPRVNVELAVKAPLAVKPDAAVIRPNILGFSVQAVPVMVGWPATLKSPPVVIEPVAWTPFDTSRPPEKEFDPVLEEVMMPARVNVPETEAVPPTSNMVFNAPPWLMPMLSEK